MDYGSRLTRASSSRAPSAIRKLMPLVSIPEMISLGGGLPNPTLFPFHTLSFMLGDQTLQLSSSELVGALQYSQTPGLPNLLCWLYKLQAQEHGEPHVDLHRSICVSSGSQEAFCRAIEMLVEVDDSILAVNPCYSGALAFLKPYGCHIVGVDSDENGVVPEVLDRILTDWDQEQQHRRPPRVLYIVPTAQNPTGSTLSRQRRSEIIRLSEKHDLIVLEDDPYWFLHSSRQDIPSLLSLDRQGRVIRFDSFSKVLSAGIRIGFVTGPTPLIERLQLHTQAYNLHTSGISQTLVLKLFDHWKLSGFIEHAKRVAAFYNGQRDAILSSAEKHLSDVAEWSAPSAGMFLWFKLKGIEDTKTLIEKKAVAAKVLFVPGQAFSTDGSKSTCVRASYSTATPEQIDTALSRLAKLVKQEIANTGSQ